MSTNITGLKSFFAMMAKMKLSEKNLYVLPVSLLWHFGFYIFIRNLESNISAEILAITARSFNPSNLYLILVILGHFIAYTVGKNSPRSAIIIYFSLAYISLVLSIVLSRLVDINYAG